MVAKISLSIKPETFGFLGFTHLPRLNGGAS